MKKILYFLLLAAFLIPMTGVSAQSISAPASSAPGTWVASINIQNPSGSPANVIISFYDGTGNDVLDFQVTPAIPAGGSRSLYLPSDVTALGSGQFSAVLSSDQPVLTVVNMSSTAPYTGDSYVGVPQGSTKQYFPGLYNNYYGFQSELVLQNSGTGTASVSIQFYNQVTGAAVGSPYTDTIAANASKTYTLSALAGLPSGNANGNLSAIVTETTTQTIAGVANTWTAAYHGEFSSYNGFAGGGTSIYVPSLTNNYYHFVSALTVQNIGTFATDVLVTFSDGSTRSASALAPGASKQWYLPSEAGLPSGNTNGVFSAKITSAGTGGNPAQPLVALVNTEDKTAGSLASYDSSASPTTTVLCPVVMKAYYHWFTAETVQNVSPTVTTDITITYPGGQHKTVTGVPPNGTVNFIELATAGSVLPDGSVVAATITSTGGAPLVAVTQENSNELYATHAGDYLFSYACTNQ